jgi:hypothetical protein
MWVMGAVVLSVGGVLVDIFFVLFMFFMSWV